MTSFVGSMRVLGPLACLIIVPPSIRAQPGGESEQRMAYMQTSAAQYAARSADDSHELTIHDQPLLRFNNLVSGVPDGIVVMWTDKTRPAALAQFFQIKDGTWLLECQSVSPTGLVMSDGQVTRWQPPADKAEFRVLDDAPQPAASAVARAAQMKRIARTFSGVDDFKIDAGDAKTTRHRLRLLPQPVYRYSVPEAGVVDGAVFAFVHGTDPEVFLILETYASDDGQRGWQFQLAPMTCWAVEMSRNGAVVWSAPERLGQHSADGMYHIWSHAAGAD